jgi:hypothetical protein
LATIGFSIYRYVIVSVMLKSLLAEPTLYPGVDVMKLFIVTGVIAD